MTPLLSWSSDASHEIATYFYTWLPEVIPTIKPWISDQDIAKGERWFSQLLNQLDRSNLSIIFITPENVRSPWVFYEAGFIAAKLDAASVCPFLAGVDIKAVKDTPLGQYQCTKAEKDDTYKLIRTINNHLGEHKHETAVLEEAFNKAWPKLKHRIAKAIAPLKAIQEAIDETEPSIEEGLSQEARDLLVAATKGGGNRIMYHQHLGGSTLIAGEKHFVDEESDERSEAVWVARWRNFHTPISLRRWIQRRDL